MSALVHARQQAAAATISFLALDAGLGAHNVLDMPCPVCGPTRSTARKAVEKKLRAWRLSERAISYCCARCGSAGFVADGERRTLSQTEIEAAKQRKTEQERFQRQAIAASRDKARFLWSRSSPINGTVGEGYLRQARGITCALPTTLRFLPASGLHEPTMIAAIGFATELQPGLLHPDNVVGVHLTRLLPDGRWKIPDTDERPAKIIFGRQSMGAPISLAPMNDLLGLAITEGIEDALSVHSATGLGAWAAGSANRLPALVTAVPAYADCVTVIEDDDEVGRRNSRDLADRLVARGIHAELRQ